MAQKAAKRIIYMKILTVSDVSKIKRYFSACNSNYFKDFLVVFNIFTRSVLSKTVHFTSSSWLLSCDNECTVFFAMHSRKSSWNDLKKGCSLISITRNKFVFFEGDALCQNWNISTTSLLQKYFFTIHKLINKFLKSWLERWKKNTKVSDELEAFKLITIVLKCKFYVSKNPEITEKSIWNRKLAAIQKSLYIG